MHGDAFCSCLTRTDRFDQNWFALTPTDDVLRHFEAMRVTAIQIGAKNFKLVSSCVKRNPTLFGQGIVLADTKTARASLPNFVRAHA